MNSDLIKAINSENAAEIVNIMTNIIYDKENMINSILSNDDKKITPPLEKVKDLLQKCLSIITKNIIEKDKKDSIAYASSSINENSDCCSSEIILVIEDTQFFEPRGRFKVSVSASGLLLEGKTIVCFLPWSKISSAACVPSNASTKKEGEDLLALSINDSESGVKINNKEVKKFLWVLSKNKDKPINTSYGSAIINGTESSVIFQLAQNFVNKNVIVDVPRLDLFQSVVKQKPYLLCYKGIQEGALYPLKSGVVFIKPLLFIPADEIAAISAGRGGGTGSTRYVDLQIETSDEKQHEFTNIERDDLPSLQNYVKGYLEERKRTDAAKLKKEKEDAKTSSNSNSPMKEGGGTILDEDDSDDEDDDDFDPDASDSEFDSDDSDDSGSDASGNSNNSSDDDEEDAEDNDNNNKDVKNDKESDTQDYRNNNNKRDKNKDDHIKEEKKEKHGNNQELKINSIPILKRSRENLEEETEDEEEEDPKKMRELKAEE